MDTITIKDLEVRFRVGVPDSERATPQRLLITVEMGLDFAAAAAADDLSRTIDYHAVSQQIQAFGEGRDWRLIEALAVDLAGMILKDHQPIRVSVEIKKFILPETRHVAVRVERTRKNEREL